MGSNISVRSQFKWEGEAYFKRYMQSVLPRHIKAATDEALNNVADDAVKFAKASAPVDTGSLKKSIRKERHARPRGNITYVGIRAGGFITNPRTGRLVDYASYVEYGTSSQRPQPFIRPAMVKALKKAYNYFWRALSKRVDTS